MCAADKQPDRCRTAWLAQLLTWGGALLLILSVVGLSTPATSRVTLRSDGSALPKAASPQEVRAWSVEVAGSVRSAVRAVELAKAGPHASSLGPSEIQTQPIPAIPTRIRIPTIGVDAPVVATTWHTTTLGGEVQRTWDVPATYAAGWHETSAPLGAGGNTVLNGHNTGHGEVFRDLFRLRPGDPVILYAGEQPFSYVVSQTLFLREAGQPVTVRQRNAEYILPTADERVTLVTCHPYGSLRERLIVIAVPEAAGTGAADAGRGEEVERP